MSETLQRKQTPLTGWNLSDQAAMLTAFGDLMNEGWRGAISHTGSTWRLELNADNPARQVIAEVGDWLVQDFELRKFSAEELAANYEVEDES